MYAEAVQEQLDVERVEVDLGEIQEMMRSNCEVFVNFFLYEQIIEGVPDFHIKIWQIMINQEIRNYACAIPRGHAKTTLAKLAVVWHLLFTDIRFIVYVSSTETISVAAAADIVGFIESENFIRTFGAVTWEKRLEGKGHYQFYLHVPGKPAKRCIIMSRGANQQVRGLNIDNQRPQLAVVDDLEDEDNTASETLHLKTKKWFFGTFLKALDKRWNKIIYIGNLIGERTIIEALLKLEDWVSTRLGCLLANGKPLWPELWSLEEIINDYRKYVELGMVSVWFAEMMNLVIAGENAIIKPDQIYYMPRAEPEDLHAGFITIDPIPDKSSSSDQACIAVHGLVTDVRTNATTPQIVDYVFGNLDPLELYSETKRLAFKWGICVIGIESVAFSATLRLFFEFLARQEGLHDLEVVKLMAATQKNIRITGWAGLIKAKAYGITINDLYIVEQLLTYNRAKRDNQDDIIDACAFGQQMLENYYGLIMEKRMGATVNVKPTRELETCGV